MIVFIVRIEDRYRSTIKPDPLWTECALYCGYTHIEIGEGLWLSRAREYILREAMDYPDRASMLLNNSDLKTYLYQPSIYESSNYLKLVRMLTRAKTFSVIGFSPALERMLQSIHYTTVYTDSQYRLPHTEAMNSRDLAISSSHILTLINSDSTNLKSHISNWGNVVVYTNSMFNEEETSPLEGGYYVGTNEPAKAK